MASYLICWKPASENAKKGWPAESLVALSKKVRANGTAIEPWRFTRRKGVRIGDRVFLLQQGQRGHAIIGYGRIAGLPPPKGKGETPILFEKLEDPIHGKVLVTQAQLEAMNAANGVWNVQVSGTLLPDKIGQTLERLAVDNSTTKKLPSRKQFIVSQGGTCRNWTWSWSFVNQRKKWVIFGTWDRVTTGNTALILSEEWHVNAKGNSVASYKQSREHIRLVEEQGYELKTFPMKYSSVKKDKDGVGPSKIESFTPKLTTKVLQKVGNTWYASDGEMGPAHPEEIQTPAQYFEGASTNVAVNRYERNAEARTKCLEHHGYACSVCSFDFENAYGAIGFRYIHVHHIVPLAAIKREYKLDPLKDLIPVCPNCHAIIHKTQPPLTIEQLRQHLESRKGN